MIGSPIGAKLIVYGRLYVLRLASIVGIIGCAFTLIIDERCMLTGRVLYGLSVGMITIAIPRFVDEVLPP